MARLASSRRNVQSPSQLVTKLIGLAPRSPVAARWRSSASGSKHADLEGDPSAPRHEDLVELPQIHPRVERRHLIGVAVERERLAAAELADPALGGLTPARMVHGRVHVGIEAVLLRRLAAPGRLGL